MDPKSADDASARVELAAFDSPLDRQLLFERLAALLPDPAPTPEVAPTVGRFTILRKLGQGGMGVVYLGYDEQLDRKVAVKLVRAGKQSRSAQLRVLREARALARLCHPNVVSIYESGSHEGELFMAVEFVAGQTLAEWLAQSRRSLAEILAVFVDAGRGLAAAHAAGLVHRDFKPTNVMITHDDRAKVTDFGLVLQAELAQTDSEDRATMDKAASGTGLTKTGAILGTPAYMAPEQHLGRAGDARTDQFGFCVALWEALYGQRPFSGTTVSMLAAEVIAGRLCEPPRTSEVPARIRGILERGLASDPDARWPSMDALLAALVDDPRKRRRRWAASLSLVVALTGLTANPLEREPGLCERLDAELVGVWDETRRREVQAAIEATGKSHAPGTWTRIDALLDGYARAWVAARTEACDATRRGIQSEQLLDRRMACLDDRLRSLAALVDTLTKIDAAGLDFAVTKARDLPSIERCADLEALSAAIPPPEDPVLAARVVALEGLLTKARSLQKSRDLDRALAMIDEVLREATQLDYPPLIARARLERADVLEFVPDYQAAETAYVEAYELALAHGMLDVAAKASERLVSVVGYKLDRPDLGRSWALHAVPLAQAAGNGQGEILNTLGVLAFNEGQLELAREQFERARALRVQELGEDHPRVAYSDNNLGVIAGLQGHYGSSREHQQRALAILERALGPEHPQVAMPLLGLGGLANVDGDHASARALAERAKKITEAALGLDHPELAYAHTILGVAKLGQGAPADAVVELERALALHARGSPPSTELAFTSFALARALWEVDDDRARARELAVRARSLFAERGPAWRLPLVEVEQWLATHGANPPPDKRIH